MWLSSSNIAPNYTVFRAGRVRHSRVTRNPASKHFDFWPFFSWSRVTKSRVTMHGNIIRVVKLVNIPTFCQEKTRYFVNIFQYFFNIFPTFCQYFVNIFSVFFNTSQYFIDILQYFLLFFQYSSIFCVYYLCKHWILLCGWVTR